MPLTKGDMQKVINEFHKKMKESVELAMENLADDAKLLVPHHEAIVGREAALKFHTAKRERDPKGEMSVAMTVEDVLEAGDLVVVDGKAVATMAGKELDNGKFLMVLRKDGANFKLVRNMWNTNKPREGQ